jgi:hypothetical protein
MPVLPNKDHFIMSRNTEYVDPIGVFQNIVRFDNFSTGHLASVGPELQPFVIHQISGMFDLPFHGFI